MKKTIFLLCMLTSIFASAQIAEKISYQAIIRDASGELVTSSEVGLKISILQNAFSEEVYAETHVTQTNQNGLVSLQIGAGETLDDFSEIDWPNGPYFIKVETDITGGANYSITSISELLSVPYALYAKTSGTSTPGLPGQDGVGIESTVDNNNGTFTLNFTDGSSFTTTDLTGPQGATDLETVLAVNNSANNQQIKNLADPTDAQDAVTKAYTYSKAEVDALIAGLQDQINNLSGNNPGNPSYPAGTVHCDPSNPTAIVDVTNPTTGKTWMDRNLGASQVATSFNDANAYGDLYQWGRGADGHQCRNSATTTTLSSTDQPAHGNFILAPNSPFDWRSPQNDNLWQGVNGINNPCPSGYRLPTETELNAERLSWISNNTAGGMGSPLKFNLVGARRGTDGAIFEVANSGSYWTSSINGTDSRRFIFVFAYAQFLNDYRSRGASVRCLKD